MHTITNNSTDFFILNETLQLKKTGTNNYVSLCPFHKETTPSFFINFNKNLFYCFGCKIGGSTPKLVSTLTKNKNYNKLINYEKKYTKNIEETYITKLLKLHNAALFFKKELNNNNSNGLNYCKKRQLTTNIIKKFHLGYAPKKQHLLKQHNFLFNQDYKSLIKFQNRLIFPIKNEFGIIVGFGGRVIEENKQPKYLNSQNTNLFKKNTILYGLYESLTHSKNWENNIILVEGFFDVLSLFKKKITNVVSTLGTTLSKNQIQTIFNFVDELIVCYDNDQSGNIAIKKHLEKISLFKFKKKKIKVITLPKYKDPDAFINTFTKKSFLTLCKNTPLINL